MTPRQAKQLEDVPPMYQGTIGKAYEGKCSPRAAIKAFCLHCTGYERVQVTNCTSLACPLWLFRPFQAVEKQAMDTERVPEACDLPVSGEVSDDLRVIQS